MNKMMLSSVSLLLVIIGGTICVQNRQVLAAIPDIENPNIQRETPPAALPDNSRLPQSNLIDRAQILSSRTLPDSAKNLSLQLTTWGSYATSREVSVELPAISQARQVWVLKDEYAEYVHPRIGTMRNAQVTTIFDAETGSFLGSSTVGTPLDRGRSALVATPVVPLPTK